MFEQYVKGLTEWDITASQKPSFTGNPSPMVLPLSVRKAKTKPASFTWGAMAGEMFAGNTIRTAKVPNVYFEKAADGHEAEMEKFFALSGDVPRPLVRYLLFIIQLVLSCPIAERPEFLKGFAEGVRHELSEPKLRQIDKIHRLILQHWPPPRRLLTKKAVLCWVRTLDPQREVLTDVALRSFRQELGRKNVLPREATH